MEECTVMLRAEQVVKAFTRPATVAVPGASLTLYPGQKLGLTGPSGCGKSTLAAMLALLLEPDAGVIDMDGQQMEQFGIRAPVEYRRQIQLLWQSPVAASDPRMRLRDIIAEARTVPGTLPQQQYPRLLERVGLSAKLLDRFPNEVSAGQLQRACVARALACNPAYLVADEPTSMLDASSQAGILRTLDEASRDSGVGIVLITHDTKLAHYWCDDVVEFDDIVDERHKSTHDGRAMSP